MTDTSNFSDDNSAPMVSVCVQTYQHVSYIEQCLNSIINQKTNFNYEVIVGEDESSDGTREICESFVKQYPDKIKLFLRSRKDVISIDGKPTGRFNFKSNLEASKGKYIAMCEGDDYWTDELKLQKQVDFLEANTKYSVCFHNVKILKDDELINDYITKVPAQTTTFADIAKGNYIHTPSVMFRNQLTLPDWFDKILAGDYALHLLNATQGKLYCINDIMAVYRVHTGGIWSTNKEDENQLRWIKMLDTLCDNFQGEERNLLNEQRVKWAIVLYEKGFITETESILKSNINSLLQERNTLIGEKNRLMHEPDYLASNVSGRYLIKSLLKKLGLSK